ncbi:Cysteine-rich RLK (RECEPTOR-like protein kinase) 8 [Cucumis melo var. makuwa]|uniref:Cysteine-rich RLK (RECEPTOR-like protein kinase) 8 n=1 Tax=Cucumis melo var. makuwa TaxID=1194695 RepID=A0A5A7V6T8_CUCMM|nr:Cysteine-rich RLK (RECEPTOR-like protein kinase) 8 [Cucumis melo var. makuwa]TYK10828.1 Cysteine-rich RLK (RECEPTOR-like protein kinase) 8 [Cucumis melo var. makuwa]
MRTSSWFSSVGFAFSAGPCICQPLSSPDQGENDDLFIYEITSLASSFLPPSSVSLPSSPPVHCIYSRCPPQQPSESCPSSPLTSSPPDPTSSDNLPIARRKGKCTCTYPISSFVSAMIEKMTALNENGPWDLVLRQTGKKEIGSKWVFAIKGISSHKTFLQGRFHTKDLGQLKYFLGIEVMRSKKVVDWAGSREDRRSTSKYYVFVGGNLLSWKSKKHNVVSRSSVESKYRAMTQFV